MSLNPFEPFAEYLRPYRRIIVLGLLLLVVVQAISSLIPLMLKWAIDAAEAARLGDVAQMTMGSMVEQPPLLDSAQRTVAVFAIWIAGLAMVQMLLSVAMRWYFARTSRYVERDIRRVYVGHLLRLPLSFFQQRRVGDVMARATNDVEAIERFLNSGIRLSLQALLNFAISLVLMCTIDWSLALFSLLPMPVLVVGTRWVSARMRGGFRRVQEQFATMSACIQENLSGIRAVKAFASGDRESERFRALNLEYVERNRHVIGIESAFYPFTYLVSGASLVLILWLGGMRVMEDSLTLGSFVAFNAYLIRMSRPMMMLGRLVDRYQRAMASMLRVKAVLREEPQILDAAESAAPIRGEIEFRHTSFAYNGKEVLKDICVRIPAGSTLAIVGRVGSGKTTMARLISRLIHAGPGQVLVDGIPIEQHPLSVSRAAVGYAPQETFLFSDTIRDNIALGGEGDEGVEDGVAERVDEAVEVAQLGADLAVIPEGLEAVVGERGVTLSGGQKQRAALARAVIRSPRILILDDAMASVDTRTEEAILNRLQQVMAARTTILIAHRISTVRGANQIIVLDEGRVIEQGTHDDLVAQEGVYADMYRRQHLAQELESL
jgi:ATP-binding cassette subfamily B protein